MHFCQHSDKKHSWLLKKKKKKSRCGLVVKNSPFNKFTPKSFTLLYGFVKKTKENVEYQVAVDSQSSPLQLFTIQPAWHSEGWIWIVYPITVCLETGSQGQNDSRAFINSIHYFTYISLRSESLLIFIIEVRTSLSNIQQIGWQTAATAFCLTKLNF